MNATELDERPLDLNWVHVCDDCLDGIHHRCRRRRKCACHNCLWAKRAPKPPEPKPTPKSNARPGCTSETRNYDPVNDDVCAAAVELYKKSFNWSRVADALNVERTNLYRAMKRRGLR